MKLGLVATYKEILDDTYNLIVEVSKYMDEVYVLIDSPQTRELPENASYLGVPNQGFDMWKFYNFFKACEGDRTEILLTNSTVSPVSSFEELMKFVQRDDLDFSWATSAYTEFIGSKPVDWYYIGSFLIYFKNDAVKDIINFFLKTGLTGKWDGVETYEFGISRMMIEKWYRYWAFLEADDMIKKYGWSRCDLWEQIKSNSAINIPKDDGEFNGVFQYPQQYLESWLPFIKNSLYKYHFKPPLIQYLSNILYKQRIELDYIEK